MLSSLPGAAITQVKIAGVKHQFSTISGVKEDIVYFFLNLKKVRFTYQGDKPVKATLSVKGAGDAKAKDIEGFVTHRNEEYFKAYEKALLYPQYRVLKNYIRKKYTSELQTHFVNVKIKNDLLTIAKTKPVNLAER